MNYLEDIKELRKRVITVIIAFLLAFIALYAFGSQKLLNLVVQQGMDLGYKMIFISPQEVLIQQLRLTAAIGFLIIFPIGIYEIVAFIAPALENGLEVARLIFVGLLTLIMFAVGCVFSIKGLLPFVLDTLYRIGLASGAIAEVTTENFISMFISFSLCMGIVFEIPLISILLSLVGVLTSKKMMRGWKVVVLFIFVVAAFITPPDIISQCIVAVPMIGLYLVSIVMCKVFERKEG